MAKKTVRQHVEYLLEQYPQARDSDKTLLMLYWMLVDNVDMQSGRRALYDSFMERATPPESITRARRLIQEEGLYPSSKPVSEERRKRQEQFKDAVQTYREVIE